MVVEVQRCARYALISVKTKCGSGKLRWVVLQGLWCVKWAVGEGSRRGRYVPPLTSRRCRGSEVPAQEEWWVVVQGLRGTRWSVDGGSRLGRPVPPLTSRRCCVTEAPMQEDWRVVAQGLRGSGQTQQVRAACAAVDHLEMLWKRNTRSGGEADKYSQLSPFATPRSA